MRAGKAGNPSAVDEASGRDDGARLRVIVVDDAPSVRLLLKRTLPFYEIDVVAEAESADGAIAVALEHQPDALLLDVHLAGSSGIDVLETLKREAPAIKILMFSNDDDPMVMSDAVELGADGYVIKLALIPDIAGEVKRVVGERTTRQV